MKNYSKARSNWFGTQTIARGTFIIAFFTILSAILGLLRDRIFATHFLVSKIGEASQSLDVYYAAFFVPDTLYYLIFLGALAAAFVPVFTSYISKKEEKEAFHIANSFLNISLFFLVILSLIIFAFAPFFVKLVAPGFEAEKQRITASLIRVMLLSPLFFGISNTAGGILNSCKRFTIFAIAPCLYNLGIIVGTLTLFEKYGVYAAAIGVIIGAFLHMLVQVIGAYFVGFRWRPLADFKHKAVKKIFKLMLPRAVALAADRINRYVFMVVASTLAVGSVSIVNLSTNLQSFPVSFFGIAVATATFPFLAEAASLNKNEDFIQNLSRGIRYILYLIIPASLIIILLRAQIVRIVFGAGSFGWTDTRLTAASLGVMALSLFAQGVIPLLCRAFYAIKNTVTPLKLSIWSILVNIAGSLLFTRHFMIDPLLSVLKLQNGFDPRVIGLPIAFSLSSIVYLALLWIKLKSKIGVFDHGIFQAVLKILLSSLVLVIIVQGSKYALGSFLDLNRGINLLIQFAVSVIAGGGVYLLSSYFLGLNESKAIVLKIAALFKK